jgi:putative spermidine/putrescine transport system permease protein
MRSITYLYLVYLFLPICLLLIGSFGQSWVNTLFPNGLTTHWYVEIWQTTAYRKAFLTSFQVCMIVCVLNLLIVTPFVWVLQVKAPPFYEQVARFAALLPIAVPELVLGFGFILAFTREITPWLGSFWLLIVGHVILTFPYFFFSLSADLERSSLQSLERVANSFGAGPFCRFRTLFLPLATQSILTGLITVAAISLGEFQLSNLIAGFMNRTYPVLLLQAFYGSTGLACAATVILLLLATMMSIFSSLQRGAGRETLS